MTKTKLHAIAISLLIASIILLGVIWWMNGMDDTWLYATSAFIILSSIFTIVAENKRDQNK